MRKDFEMNDEQLNKLMESMQPVPMIMLQCGPTPSVQERANSALAALGKELGFKPMTVRPSVKGDKFFSAETV